jgi:hypothetical protein
VAVDTPTSKIIVIDTANYAGNFERELCAYVTGQYGECGVGDDLAQQVASEIRHIGWWNDHIAHEADDRGCHRPASIWTTPGWFNNGSGGHYRDDPANYEAARAAAVQSMKDWHAQHEVAIRDRLARNDFEPESKPGAWTKEACLSTIERNAASVQRVAESQHRYPAYLSVAIFVDEFPAQEVLDELKERAAHYCANYKSFSRFSSIDVIELTGFRLVEPEYKLSERPMP